MNILKKYDEAIQAYLSGNATEQQKDFLLNISLKLLNMNLYNQRHNQVIFKA